VTGASRLDLDEVASKLAQLRAFISIPIGVGFGIRDNATAKAIAGIADAVVVGSRLVEEIERSPRDQILANVAGLMASLRGAMDEASPAIAGR
jgi:tryptophan synthase alpha chain